MGSKNTQPGGFLEALKRRFTAEGAGALAEAFNVTKGTVWRWARRLGLKSTKDREAYSARQMAANKSVDQTFFDRWSHDMAYVLGYTFADGSVTKDGHTIRYDCHRRDEDVILAVRTALRSSHKVSRRKGGLRCGRREGPKTIFVVSSTRLANAARSRGVHPRKSYRDDPIPDVPEEYLVSFARGYFDGDGGVSLPEKGRGSVSFTGTPRFIRGLQHRICRAAGLPACLVKVSRTGAWAQVVWQNLAAWQTIYHWLYPPGRYLHGRRKRRRLEELIRRARKRRRVPASGFRGVQFWSDGIHSYWHASVNHHRVPFSLGYHRTRHEAAFAYNVAAQLLKGERTFLNSILPEHMPDEERQAAIRKSVLNRIQAKRLANHFRVEKG